MIDHATFFLIDVFFKSFEWMGKAIVWIVASVSWLVLAALVLTLLYFAWPFVLVGLVVHFVFVPVFKMAFQ